MIQNFSSKDFIKKLKFSPNGKYILMFREIVSSIEIRGIYDDEFVTFI